MSTKAEDRLLLAQCQMERDRLRQVNKLLLDAAKGAEPHMRGAAQPSSSLTEARTAREALRAAIAAAEKESQ